MLWELAVHPTDPTAGQGQLLVLADGDTPIRWTICEPSELRTQAAKLLEESTAQHRPESVETNHGPLVAVEAAGLRVRRGDARHARKLLAERILPSFEARADQALLRIPEPLRELAQGIVADLTNPHLTASNHGPLFRVASPGLGLDGTLVWLPNSELDGVQFALFDNPQTAARFVEGDKGWTGVFLLTTPNVGSGSRPEVRRFEENKPVAPSNNECLHLLVACRAVLDALQKGAPDGEGEFLSEEISLDLAGKTFSTRVLAPSLRLSEALEREEQLPEGNRKERRRQRPRGKGKKRK